MALKTLFLAACLCVIVSCRPGDNVAGEAALPHGPAPAPIATRHFPDRLHEFVWRNWNLASPDKLAKLLGASAADITAMADSMGLPPAAAVPLQQKSRGYITLIRRNWHLLPYDQLLELLEMTPEQLAFSLREDDFLWIKVGSLKPKCERLRYVAPDAAARERAARIKQVVVEEFGDALRQPAEPRFGFLARFAAPAARPDRPTLPATGDQQHLALRFIYSYSAVYGDPLASPELDPYPDGLLQQLSALGVNGVWLHVVLRDLAPGGTAFPEFGAGHERRLASLRALVARAKHYGIGVYLYMNEPRAMPAAFFKDRPEMAGVREGELVTLCTSHPAVRRWMSDSLAYVFRQVPDLAGLFTITASENLTNCASHGQWRQCPRCRGRSDAEILAEVNATIAEGVHRGSPTAKVIAWDWGWRGDGDVSQIIARLPKSAWFMSVSEWAVPIDRGGVRKSVGEYSLSAVGPGERARRRWKEAQAAGLKTVAKVQINNTWELSTVPYLPVMDLVARHCRNLASAGVDGMMLSWSLGGYPSPNLEIAARFRVQPTPSVDEVLDALAVQQYGVEGAPLARRAWTAFSTAFQQYPFDPTVLYLCPVHVGPANPLYLEKTGYAATMTGIPYDDLKSWRGPYPLDVFTAQFAKVAEGWQAGIPDLEAAVRKAPVDRRDEAEAELRFARVAAIHFQSVVNQAAYNAARDALADRSKTLSAQERQGLREVCRRSLNSEIALARRLFPLAQADSRIGFEAANQYFYVPLDLAEKIINCRWLLEHL